MKLSNLISDSETKPFRFAVVLAAIIVVVLLTSKGKAQENTGTSTWSTSFQEAVKKADEQNAPILLYFSGSDWCPWTAKLSTEVFAKQEFSSWTDGRVVTMVVDFPRKHQLPASLANQNNSLLERYRQHLGGFPTALFVKPDGTVIGKLGYEPEGIRAWIHKAQKIVGKLDKVT